VELFEKILILKHSWKRNLEDYACMNEENDELELVDFCDLLRKENDQIQWEKHAMCTSDEVDWLWQL